MESIDNNVSMIQHVAHYFPELHLFHRYNMYYEPNKPISFSLTIIFNQYTKLTLLVYSS